MKYSENFQTYVTIILAVIAPGTLGIIPATSLGQASIGWRKAHQKCHAGLINREEPLMTISDIIYSHITYHITQSHGFHHNAL